MVRAFVIGLFALVGGSLCAEMGYTLLDNGNFEKLSGSGRVTCWRGHSSWHTVTTGVNGSRALAWVGRAGPASARPYQDVPVESNRIYRLTAAVCVAGTGTAFAAVDWYNAQGVRLNGVRTDLIADTHGDWQTLSALTPRLPAGAVRAHVYLSANTNLNGKVIFDNVAFARELAVRVRKLTTSIPSNQAADGTLDVTAELDDLDVDITAYSAFFSWRGADGRIHTAPPTERDTGAAHLTLAVRDLALGASQLAFVLIRPNGQIDTRKEITFTRVNAPPSPTVF